MTKRLHINTKCMNFLCKNVMNLAGFLFEIAHCCFKFLKQGKIIGIVTEKDSPTGGPEIPCLLTFEGTCGKIQIPDHEKRYKTETEAPEQVEDTYRASIQRAVWSFPQ